MTTNSTNQIILQISTETICFIIAKAHEFHAKEQVVFPEESDSPDDDWALQVLADHASDPTYLELKSAIDNLSPEEQVELVALMWLGRGVYESEEWRTALEEARENWNERTAEYLIGTPLVADYLEEGLAQLGYTCTE
jgi:hypothetical protein